MSHVIVLDASPLGLICHSNPRGDAVVCQKWFDELVLNGHRVVFPAIADFEVRQELIRARKAKSLARLDFLTSTNEYIELDDAMLMRAAGLWAQARRAGLPTAGPAELDCDVILAAQALSLNDPGVIVATSNVGHLGRFIRAEDWRNIPTT